MSETPMTHVATEAFNRRRKIGRWKLYAVGAAAVAGALLVIDARLIANRNDDHRDDWVLLINPGESVVAKSIAGLLGKDRGQLAGTQVEYWTVPSSYWHRVAVTLSVFGIKVSRLPDDWTSLLKPQPATADHADLLKRVNSGPEFVSAELMKAQEAAVAEYALTLGADTPSQVGGKPPKATSRLVIPLKNGVQVTMQRAELLRTGKGTSWRGTVEDTGESAMLMWWKDGHISGVFAYKGRIYTIVNLVSDLHAVVESDPAKLPPDHSPATADSAKFMAERAEAQEEAVPRPVEFKPLSQADLNALQAKKIGIDVMMLYTKKAALQNVRKPAEVIEMAIDQGNATFRNSGIPNVSLRLVHAEAIDYDESSGKHFEHLYGMVDGVAVFKGVRKLRDDKRADVVGLIVDDPSGCGLSTRVGADAEEAFFVVHLACATLTNSIAHEVGHIIGARHDRSIDKGGHLPYAHGYVNGSKWRDIMSYHEACNGCPRIPFWSNPRVTYQGEPTGTPLADNARVILEQAERVSKFR